MHGGANRAVPAPVPVTAGAGVPLYLTKPGNRCLGPVNTIYIFLVMG